MATIERVDKQSAIAQREVSFPLRRLDEHSCYQTDLAPSQGMIFVASSGVKLSSRHVRATRFFETVIKVDFSGLPAGAELYMAWFDNTPGNFDIYFRKSADGGSTWQSIQNITNTSGTSENPQIAYNSTNIYVVSDDDTPGNYEIYLKY